MHLSDSTNTLSTALRNLQPGALINFCVELECGPMNANRFPLALSGSVPEFFNSTIPSVLQQWDQSVL
eukprot:SAG31_NODE_18186_length_644_cov_0.943119_2_plen_67_part_01